MCVRRDFQMFSFMTYTEIMFGTGQRRHRHGIFLRAHDAMRLLLGTGSSFAVGEASSSAFFLLLLVNCYPNFSEEIFSLIKGSRLVGSTKFLMLKAHYKTEMWLRETNIIKLFCYQMVLFVSKMYFLFYVYITGVSSSFLTGAIVFAQYCDQTLCVDKLTITERSGIANI